MRIWCYWSFSWIKFLLHCLLPLQRSKIANWILHKPSLPIAYGTHHSKAMLLVYPTGVRVIIHTANLISIDWNNKSQGLWMQDFPWKNQNNLDKDGGFENDLVDYLSALKVWMNSNPKSKTTLHRIKRTLNVLKFIYLNTPKIF